MPPPLLQQLKPDGIMVIPIGPPGAQHVLKVIKTVAATAPSRSPRSDIYSGCDRPFVPFTKLEGDAISGRHDRATTPPRAAGPAGREADRRSASTAWNGLNDRAPLFRLALRRQAEPAASILPSGLPPAR